MKDRIKSKHWVDTNGNPDGGTTIGNGFTIGWQCGPMTLNGSRLIQNGAFVEDVIEAAADRISHYQETKFVSNDNAEALGYLAKAIECLQRRTKSREAKGIEGTHEVG